jgi:hypothetical protein
MDDKDITIDMESFSIDTSSIASSNYMFSSPANQTYSIATGATGSMLQTGALGSSASWTTNSTAWPSSITNGSAGLHVTSNAVFDGDVTIKGSNIAHTLKKIEDRLAILQDPDPAKLEKFAALKKAYDNYKMLERLIGDDSGTTEST